MRGRTSTPTVDRFHHQDTDGHPTPFSGGFGVTSYPNSGPFAQPSANILEWFCAADLPMVENALKSASGTRAAMEQAIEALYADWSVPVPLTILGRLYPRALGCGVPDLIESAIPFSEDSTTGCAGCRHEGSPREFFKADRLLSAARVRSRFGSPGGPRRAPKPRDRMEPERSDGGPSPAAATPRPRLLNLGLCQLVEVCLLHPNDDLVTLP